MSIRIGRTLSPAAAPIYLKDIVSGIIGLIRGGKTVKDFEEELKEYYQVRHCFAVSSGKTALTAILLALKEISPGRDEVLIPAFTCYSVPSAIIRAGLKIRLCDLDPKSFDFDYDQFTATISQRKERLLCVLPVHLFGFSADISRIKSIIADNSVIIVEDAAQAMGGEFNGQKLGTLGDVGLFSLGRGKAFSTVEGGVILTKRDDIARHLEKTVNNIPGYGGAELFKLLMYSMALFVLSRPSLFWIPKAIPFLRLGETIYDPHFKMRTMSPFQAGLARGWESKLQNFRRVRSENVQEFLNILEPIGLKPAWGNKSNLPDLIRFPLRIESAINRESILHSSENKGLGIARTYPASVDSIAELNTHFTSHHFPIAKQNAENLITLPIHPYITRKARGEIACLLEQARE